MTNQDMLKQFYSDAIPYLSGIETHLDIGHGKNLKFILNIADSFKDSKTRFMYYDNRDFIERLIAKRNKIALPNNVELTSSPKGPIDSASYFFTIHDFLGTSQSPQESFKEVCGLTSPGGLVLVIDYDLFHVRTKPNSQHAFSEVFNNGNEKKCLLTEPDCYEKHTSYSRAMCVRDLEASGFALVKAYSLPEEDPKLFLALARRW